MLQCYRNTIWHKPSKVLGKQLKPYSLAHSYVLDSMEINPNYLTFSELVSCLLVCSIDAYPFANVNKIIRSRFLDWKIRIWGMKVKAKNIGREIDKFRRYLTTYQDSPKRTFDPAKTRTIKTPWQLSIVLALMGNRYDAANAKAIWNMPLCEALAIKATIDARNGDDGILGEEEENMPFVEEVKNE